MAASTYSHVDPIVWHAVAGASVQIPAINSYVYYFPEGHLEHSPYPQNCSVSLRRSMILCQVLSVSYLSSRSSDQAFVKILLQPLCSSARSPQQSRDDGFDQEDVVAFAKILTPSDANNGGGFSVPRFCADSIFPRLDFDADPPVQNLTMKDTHDNAWEFRHIYRGTPRRHLLTTGWSKFVNGKRLVAGDSVVFMRRKPSEELFIGIRRAGRFGGREIAPSYGGGGSSDGEMFESMENAAKMMAFEVLYYPRVGQPDFVVGVEKVEESLRTQWSSGMRVRMPVETEDLSRMSWFQGTVEAVISPEIGLWRGSPWRMLKVNWDGPEVVHNMNRVSPWQVERIQPTPQFESPFPPACKRSRILQPEFPLSMEGLTRSMSMSGHLNYSPLIHGGIQGSSREKISISNATISLDGPGHQMSFNQLLNNELELEPELNIGSSHSSSNSQSSVHFSGTDLFGHNPSGKYGGGCHWLRLFGKIIHVSEPGERSSIADEKKHEAEDTDHSSLNPFTE